jgi:hypothetical protein
MGGRSKRYLFAIVGTLLSLLACFATSCSQSNDGPLPSPTVDAGTRPSQGDGAGDASLDASVPSSIDDVEAGDGGTHTPTDSGVPVDGTPPTPDGAPPVPTSTPPQPLVSTTSFYPRAIQLADGTILASVVATQASGRLGATILESDDDAISFHVVGTIDDAKMAGGLCCGTLYELPKATGTLAAGALFWAASLGQGQSAAPMTIGIWVSADRGHTWAFSSNAVVASAPYSGGNGLWEPEFSMLDDGTLVCHYSNETDPAHSQKLSAVRSTDGVSWGNAEDTVAPIDSHVRPGMANVRRPTGGPFILSYEVCGVAGDDCAAHMRTSTDGWNWGDPTNVGSQPQTVDGLYFAHAPTLAWTGSPGPMGRLYLMGQMTMAADGGVASQNGNFLLASPQEGNQFWYALPAPVPVPSPFNNFCPNYSSAILPLDDGKVALEIASRVEGTDCRAYFARGPLTGTGDRTGLADGGVYRFVSTMSGLCLDVAGGSLDAGGNVQQWTCDGLSPQEWIATAGPGQTVTLAAENSGMCLSFAGAAADAGTSVDQLPCDGSPAQSWTVDNVGLGYFAFAQPSAGTCLDVAGGSTTPGGNVQVWTCNALAPQIWHAERQ